MDPSTRKSAALRIAAAVLALGAYLSLRGYHSHDGDQAYRLPLLIHQQNPFIYANDPFVRSFEAFNPHRGYLTILDLASRPLGLSFGIAVLFAITFVATCLGIERLGRLCWPETGPLSSTIAVVMLLVAKAGNIGTNHLFESMLLDRLIAMAIGWIAIADLIDRPQHAARASLLLGLATLIHPSMGLQLGALMVTSLVVWQLVTTRENRDFKSMTRAIVCLLVGLSPGVILMSRQGARLTDGLSAEDFYTLSALVQSPQHMVPHLWRMNQWLAWACYPVLALISLSVSVTPWTEARKRTAIVTGLTLCGLLAAWIGIELARSLSLTLLQPFRMATTARGLCLVLAADHVRALGMSGKLWPRCRALMLVLALSSDLALVVATLVEVISLVVERVTHQAAPWIGLSMLGLGAGYLSQHDTESGQWCLLVGLGLGLVWHATAHLLARWSWNTRRFVLAGVVCWFIPTLAMIPPNLLPASLSARLVKHCRFWEIAVDDIERLAVWCREHTPPRSRFVTPPGPKTFRLWSRREVAFNRASGPYHAAGLADWARRYRQHVNFSGTLGEFASEYLKNRQVLDRRFDDMTQEQMGELARGQGAQFLVADVKTEQNGSHSSLSLIHQEGRFGVYHVQPRSVMTVEELQSPSLRSASTIHWLTSRITER